MPDSSFCHKKQPGVSLPTWMAWSQAIFLLERCPNNFRFPFLRVIGAVLPQEDVRTTETFTRRLIRKSTHANHLATAAPQKYSMFEHFFFNFTGSKCYGIAPENRKDCGYFGIGRDECETDKGCCFDHTVQGVPWCFFGRKRPAPVPPQTEVSAEEPTEEGATEGSTEEPTEPPVGGMEVRV